MNKPSKWAMTVGRIEQLASYKDPMEMGKGQLLLEASKVALENQRLTTALADYKAVIEELDGVLNRVKRHDVSGKHTNFFGYGSNHPILGINPSQGARWLTPRELAEQGLAAIAALKERGVGI